MAPKRGTDAGDGPNEGQRPDRTSIQTSSPESGQKFSERLDIADRLRVAAKQILSENGKEAIEIIKKDYKDRHIFGFSLVLGAGKDFTPFQVEVGAVYDLNIATAELLSATYISKVEPGAGFIPSSSPVIYGGVNVFYGKGELDTFQGPGYTLAGNPIGGPSGGFGSAFAVTVNELSLTPSYLGGSVGWGFGKGPVLYKSETVLYHRDRTDLNLERHIRELYRWPSDFDSF